MSHWTLPDGATLRLLTEADSAELFALVHRNRSRLGQYLPWVHATHAPADVASFLRSATVQHASGLGFHAGIELDGRLAGCAGMHPIDLAHANVSLGYWIDEQAEGRGLATQATAELVRICFADFGLRRVEIRCAAGNLRSRAVPLRLGFREEGLLRDAQLVNGRYFDLHVFGKLSTD